MDEAAPTPNQEAAAAAPTPTVPSAVKAAFPKATVVQPKAKLPWARK